VNAISRTILDNFWSRVQIGGPDECWLWTGPTTRGYGNISGRAYAHRVAWELSVGPIPKGIQIDHICFVRNCVNPAHLRLATNKQNNEHKAGPQRNNRSTGVRGVYPNHRRWMVKVKHNGVSHYGGTFDTIKEAEAAAVALRNKMFTHNEIDRRRTIADQLDIAEGSSVTNNLTREQLTALAFDMRSTAAALEKISAHYTTTYHPPAVDQRWSARLLREEANHLERP
jgi:hypothetical protein